jgi:hypothetical protein
VVVRRHTDMTDSLMCLPVTLNRVLDWCMDSKCSAFQCNSVIFIYRNCYSLIIIVSPVSSQMRYDIDCHSRVAFALYRTILDIQI